jgi:hypothetical protein
VDGDHHLLQRSVKKGDNTPKFDLKIITENGAAKQRRFRRLIKLAGDDCIAGRSWPMRRFTAFARRNVDYEADPFDESKGSPADIGKAYRGVVQGGSR